MLRNRDGTTGPLHITDTGRELRPLDTAERDYIESLIDRAIDTTKKAREMADLFGLAETHERLTWALDFQRAARDKLPTKE